MTAMFSDIFIDALFLKLLLHPIKRVYTPKCAANNVENMRYLGSMVAEICTCKQGIFSQQECHYLNINKQTATSYRSHSGLIWMQGTRE